MDRPNVFVVVIDALRQDHVGIYCGCRRIQTPAIDEVATDGVTFEQAFTTTNATDPAILSLLSGRYPTQTLLNHGERITDEDRRRAWGTTRLPPVLQDSGYRTIQTGRGLGRWIADGFDIYQDPVEQWGDGSTLAQIRTQVESIAGDLLGTLSPSLAGQIGAAYRDGPDCDPVGDLLDELDDQDDDRPVFALSHLMDTHAGYSADNEFLPSRWVLEHFNTDTSLDHLAGEFGRDTPTGERCAYFARKWAHLVDGPVRLGLVEAMYRACVRQADARVGRLVDGLRERGLLEDSWLVILADHGESLSEHGIYHDHHGLYDETVRIPLVVRPPGGDDGRRISDLVQITDVAPTIADIAGIDLGPTDGQCLLPLINDDHSGWDPRHAVIADESYCQRRSMIRTPVAKLIYAPDGLDSCRYCDRVHGADPELFDLSTDPDEQSVITGDDRAVSRLREIDRQVRGGLCAAPIGIEIDSNPTEQRAVANQLEALGYR